MFSRFKRSVSLFLVLCLHKIDNVGTLIKAGSKDKMGTLAKAVRSELPKFCKAAGKKHGEAAVAKLVAGQSEEEEVELVLAFLDGLAPSSATQLAPESLVEACLEIQKEKSGGKDPRYIIPIVSSLDREVLLGMLPSFITAGDNVLEAAFARMRERLARSYNQYRVEGGGVKLKGMTSCEQLVALHELNFAYPDFKEIGGSRRYLDLVKKFIENGEVRACRDEAGCEERIDEVLRQAQ